MTNLINLNTRKRTLIAIDFLLRAQNDAPLPDEFRVAAIATLTSTLMTPSSLSTQTLSPAQRALYYIPLRILQAATYEHLEKAMEA